MRKALATLPWVEQDTIQMNFKARELRFCLKDKSQFNEEALKKALKAEGFPDVQVKTGPSPSSEADVETP
ncbi:MAG TPA: hypothetical protein VH575_18750 [Gemmataceae bacterium]